jgi:predicted CXXCH cytochrome family protein
MQKNNNNNLVYFLSIFIVVLYFGCTVQQTHQVLLFFFDGVDKNVNLTGALSKDSLAKISGAKRDALLKKNRPDLCVHKPYKEKKCDNCHTPDKRLLMPMPNLCFKCHKNFSEQYEVVHGPVASGGCMNCHNQHSSKYDKLLIRQGQQICLYCHTNTMVFANKVHHDIEDAECTMCHSPHGGKGRTMLKENISKDANRIAIMSQFTYRHLYGKIECRQPEGVSKVTEVTITDSLGNIVSVSHPDDSGIFLLSNVHPNYNYIINLKMDYPGCRITLLDNDGNIVSVLEKNKKGKIIFDRKTYETVHATINDAHSEADTLGFRLVSTERVKENYDQPGVAKQFALGISMPKSPTPEQREENTISDAILPNALKESQKIMALANKLRQENAISSQSVTVVDSQAVTIKKKTLIKISTEEVENGNDTGNGNKNEGNKTAEQQINEQSARYDVLNINKPKSKKHTIAAQGGKDNGAKTKHNKNKTGTNGKLPSVTTQSSSSNVTTSASSTSAGKMFLYDAEGNALTGAVHYSGNAAQSLDSLMKKIPRTLKGDVTCIFYDASGKIEKITTVTRVGDGVIYDYMPGRMPELNNGQNYSVVSFVSETSNRFRTYSQVAGANRQPLYLENGIRNIAPATEKNDTERTKKPKRNKAVQQNKKPMKN